jgi:26S proteasome regulatory subunit N5
MRWPGIESLYGPTLRQTPVFAPDSALGIKSGSKSEGRSSDNTVRPGDARWEDLHKRVVEHVSYSS